jgi:hypothetical protein
MQPISNQQSAPSENSQSHEANIPKGNTIYMDTNDNNNYPNNHETEGGEYLTNDMQTIEAIYEGIDTTETTNEIVPNITPTE